MRGLLVRFVLSSFLGLLAGGTASAATLTGTVRNGSTGKPAAGVDVILLRLQGGMEGIANTKTDAQGRFRIDDPAVGQQPMLVRAVYKGVNFHQPLPPGRSSVNVEVFEPTADPRSVQITSRVIVLQPNGATLLVGEEYTVQNNTKPPAAYFKADGNFEFQIPDNAELADVSAWGPAGMPVVQGTLDRGKHRYAISFAFHPGESGVRVSYQIAYTGNQATWRAPSPYAAGRVVLLLPSSMQVASEAFEQAGNQQGFNVFTRNAVPAGTPFQISVSGTAPPPADAAQGEQQEPQGRDAGVPLEALPGRLESVRWILIAGFAALFILGAVFLWRRPVAVNAEAGAAALPQERSSPKKKKETPAAKETKLAEDVQRAVNHSLDEIKDTLFRLELRRQAGTISEAEYARERGRTEKILRDLVKG